MAFYQQYFSRRASFRPRLVATAAAYSWRQPAAFGTCLTNKPGSRKRISPSFLPWRLLQVVRSRPRYAVYIRYCDFDSIYKYCCTLVCSCTSSLYQYPTCNKSMCITFTTDRAHQCRHLPSFFLRGMRPHSVPDGPVGNFAAVGSSPTPATKTTAGCSRS